MIVVGRVTRPHGIAGELKVECDPFYMEALLEAAHVLIGEPPQRARVVSARVHQRAVLLRLEHTRLRSDAEALRGALVRLTSDQLPDLGDHRWYPHQLIGLRVLRAGSDELLGTLTEVLATGSNDVYVVQKARGELLLPALPDVIRQVDLEAGVMRVVVPEGLE